MRHECWRCAEKPEPITFSFAPGDLLKEAEKRTSYMGKMRDTDKEPDLIDRMSLTEGEGFLSEEFLADAMEQVYDWVRAFGRTIENACVIDEETGNIVYTLQPEVWWDKNAYSRVDRNLKEALVNYIIYRWYEFVKTDEAQYFFEKYENYAHEAQLGMNAEEFVIQRRYNTF